MMRWVMLGVGALDGNRRDALLPLGDGGGPGGGWEWERLMETGGMPSSHSATVVALAVGIGMSEGWGSTLFDVAVVLASIVMYDATGIRRAAGMHAARLNDLFEELRTVIQRGPEQEPLKELLGHTYLEVVVGAILGGLFAWLSFSFF
ncbi:Divergent PAP2 family protein [Acinetobacter baumannii]|nr:Divergent PAP2 family protein [Acinetobacter baumannii]